YMTLHRHSPAGLSATVPTTGHNDPSYPEFSSSPATPSCLLAVLYTSSVVWWRGPATPAFAESWVAALAPDDGRPSPSSSSAARSSAWTSGQSGSPRMASTAYSQ